MGDSHLAGQLCPRPAKRRRHSSAPDRFNQIDRNIHYDNYSLLPSFYVPQPYKKPCYNLGFPFNANDNVKVSFQSIKFLFPPCEVKLPVLKVNNTPENGCRKPTHTKPKVEDIKRSIEEIDQVNKENEDNKCEDTFIEIEWDLAGESNTTKQIETQKNVKVTEIFVLKPRWLKPHCKKVIFRDCHVNLDKIEENVPIKLETIETTEKQTLSAPKEIEKGPELVHVKRFKCEKCQEDFAQKYQLKIHTVIVHNLESPYQCKFCGKGFSLSVNLQKHCQLDRCNSHKRKTC